MFIAKLPLRMYFRRAGGGGGMVGSVCTEKVFGSLTTQSTKQNICFQNDAWQERECAYNNKIKSKNPVIK